MHETEGRTGTITVAAALALAVLVLVAFWPVAAGTRSFFHMDLCYEHLPIWEVAQNRCASGQAPVWLDGEYCGHPALFHQEAPLFYPLTVPSFGPARRAPAGRSLHPLHLWLAGFAMFLFVRKLTNQPAAALSSAGSPGRSRPGWFRARSLSAVAVLSALLPLLLLGPCCSDVDGGARASS
jgi:hypothetical protein